MSDPLADSLESRHDLPTSQDEDFYVSISRAVELTHLSESRIRYIEKVSPIKIGRKGGPHGRNRVYTRRDIELLKWIAQQRVRPAEIGKKLGAEQVIIKAGYSTLRQAIGHDNLLGGQGVLISKLITLLLLLWQTSAQETEATQGRKIEGIILGPQNEDWKTSFQESVNRQQALDLSECLVAWPNYAADGALEDLKIFFSHYPWYLTQTEEAADYHYDTGQFQQQADPFAVVIVRSKAVQTAAPPQEHLRLLSKRPARFHTYLPDMLLSSLGHVVESILRPASEPITIYSRSTLSKMAAESGLSLLLKACISPYFPESYAYIAQFEDEKPHILTWEGDPSRGYLPSLAEEEELPWWVDFARKRASIALAENVINSAFTTKERGSVVCLPLMGIGEVLGVLGIESFPEHHSLKERQGTSSQEWLQYLRCIAEIASDYLTRLAANQESTRRSRQIFVKHSALTWHLNIYRWGGLNYTRGVEHILYWLEETNVALDAPVWVALIDLMHDEDLAKEYEGYDVITDILQEMLTRIKDWIQRHAYAAKLAKNQQLLLIDDFFGDHLLLAATQIDRDSLLLLLKDLQKLWQPGTNPLVKWEGKKVVVAFQIGICQFHGLRSSEPAAAFHKMNSHLEGLARRIAERHRKKREERERLARERRKQELDDLSLILEYEATIPTDR